MTSSSTQHDETPLGFEEALRRLDRTVARLEGGELDLDGALAEYEQGVHLLTRCRSMLDAAEKQVALLTGVDDDGQPLTSPFETSATTGTRPAAPRPVAPDDDAPF
jgi:exodeoxyribonuclease VII small subunit